MAAWLLVLIAYLIGSVSFSVLAGHLFLHTDIRALGSGNAGATNILRTIGFKAAAPVFILDMLKGVAAVWLGKSFSGSPLVVALCALAAIAGHNWPVWFGFRGGKGIATSLGVSLALAWPVAFIIAVLAMLVVAVTRYVSLASMTAMAALPVLLYLFHYPKEYIGLALIMSPLAIWRHKKNISKLLAGKESKVGDKIVVPGNQNKK